MTRHITHQQGNNHHKKQNKDNTTQKYFLKPIDNLGVDG